MSEALRPSPPNGRSPEDTSSGCGNSQRDGNGVPLCAVRVGQKVSLHSQTFYSLAVPPRVISPKKSFAQVVENSFENLQQSRYISSVSVGNIVGNTEISAFFPKNEQTPLKSHENPTDVLNFSTFSEKFSTETAPFADAVPVEKCTVLTLTSGRIRLNQLENRSIDASPHLWYSIGVRFEPPHCCSAGFRNPAEISNPTKYSEVHYETR